MHEMAITRNLLDLALRHAEEASAKRIIRLHLLVGDLASVVDESVQFYWDILSQGTLAEGSVLEFERVPAEMYCRDCRKQYPVQQGELMCAYCGGVQVEVCAGTEFLLNAIEITE